MGDISPLLAFALTCVIIEITPGPNMTYLAALSLSNGMRTGYAAVAGIALGLMTYGVTAALGLAALIDNSPFLYGLLRWSGVAYLLWLAWESWATEREATPQAVDGKDGQPWLAFRRGLITNLLNPKAFLFYITVLPGFAKADAPYVVQIQVLTLLYVMVATLVHMALALGAGGLKDALTHPQWRERAGLVAAIMLLAIAVWVALKT